MRPIKSYVCFHPGTRQGWSSNIAILTDKVRPFLNLAHRTNSVTGKWDHGLINSPPPVLPSQLKFLPSKQYPKTGIYIFILIPKLGKSRALTTYCNKPMFYLSEKHVGRIKGQLHAQISITKTSIKCTGMSLRGVDEIHDTKIKPK